MKKIRITYWISTSLIGLLMINSAYGYFTHPGMDQAFQHLGFPSYFRVELAIAKIAGVILLLSPFAARIKEWAYAGFTIVFLSASIAHIAKGDPVSASITPLVFLIILAVSYFTYHKLNNKREVFNVKKVQLYPQQNRNIS